MEKLPALSVSLPIPECVNWIDAKGITSSLWLSFTKPIIVFCWLWACTTIIKKEVIRRKSFKKVFIEDIKKIKYFSKSYILKNML